MLLRVPSAPTTGWRGRIFLDAGWILYVGPGSSADLHEHHAVQFVWAHDSTFELTLDHTLHRKAALIPANTPHTLMAVDRTIALLLVDPNGGRGVALERVARSDVGAELSAKLTSAVFPTPDITALEARTWCNAVLQSLGASTSQMDLSSVSRRAIAYVERTIDGVPRVADAAAAVRLSATRLTHIFSNEVGIPFRRFVLWTRIKRAVDVFQAGNDLSTSAIAAGFSDAAHFNRTFRAMFGLSPSLVLPLAEISGTAWTSP
jgi:AraC-like DNA-binding protein